MLFNHFKTAVRQATKYKGYTLINLLGLVVGLVSCIPIFVWLHAEISTDRFHAKADRIYQLYRNMYMGSGDIETTPGVPQPLAVLLDEAYPEVENVTLYSWEQEALFRLGDKKSYESGRMVSPSFFEVFSFPFIEGDRPTALNQLHGVVISERLAEKFFGTDWKGNTIGQLIKIGDTQEYAVTGVIENTQPTSSLQFDWLISAEEYVSQNAWVTDWGNGGFRMYITLRPDADPDTFRKKIENEVNDHTDYDADERVYAQLFADTYLHSQFENGFPVGGRIEYVKVLAAVAFFLLIIACINFMNLATARASMRAREVGVRKVLGAQRASLRVQFFVESFLHAVISIGIALAIVMLMLPYFSEMFGRPLVINYLSPYTWLGVGAIALITGMLSGSYPALLLSSFTAINSLKGSGKSGGTGIKYIRLGLAVLQFTISIILISGTIVISQQMDFILTKSLGLNKENVLMMRLQGELSGRADVLRTEVTKIPEIKSITFTSGNPLSYGRSTGGATWDGKNPDYQVEINVLSVGPDFLHTMGIQMSEGEGFADDPKRDSARFLINETLAGIMGFEQVVGQSLSFWGLKGPVIGVVKDFHTDTMYEPIAPMIIRYAPDEASLAIVRTQDDTQKALQALEDLSRKLNPAYPFIYQFMDDQYEQSYRSENALASMFDYFAVVAIFISCLGLFGLSSFSADRRSKEIGIRKVHGASVSSVMLLLSRDYAVLMAIAFVVAAPLAYLYLDGWLSTFAFRIRLNWLFFLIAGALAFLIGTATVSVKSWQAASINPARTLREE
ncbi:MAG: ABC transporter permease [Cyclobacteriaceae bacterium]